MMQHPLKAVLFRTYSELYSEQSLPVFIVSADDKCAISLTEYSRYKTHENSQRVKSNFPCRVCEPKKPRSSV